MHEFFLSILAPFHPKFFDSDLHSHFYSQPLLFITSSRPVSSHFPMKNLAQVSLFTWKARLLWLALLLSFNLFLSKFHILCRLIALLSDILSCANMRKADILWLKRCQRSSKRSWETFISHFIFQRQILNVHLGMCEGDEGCGSLHLAWFLAAQPTLL